MSLYLKYSNLLGRFQCKNKEVLLPIKPKGTKLIVSLYRDYGVALSTNFEIAILKARAQNISSLSIYTDVFGCNDEKLVWFSNFMKSGLRKEAFFSAFGLLEDGRNGGKKRRVKINPSATVHGNNNRSFFDEYILNSLAGSATFVSDIHEDHACCWRYILFVE